MGFTKHKQNKMSSWQHTTCTAHRSLWFRQKMLFCNLDQCSRLNQLSSVLPRWLIPTLDYKTNIYKISQFAFLSLFAEVKNHLNTTMLCGNIFERWRMTMFLLHCGVGCQERWSWPCTMSRHGPRYFHVQPVELLPICSNRKAEMISKRLEAGCVSLHGHDGTWPSAASHTVILPVFGLRWGGELWGTSTTQLFLHASDTLHVRALCEDLLFTSLRMPLCTQQHTVEHQLGRPPALLLHKKTPELKSPEMAGKTSLKTDELWLLDEIMSLITQLITIWSDGKKTQKLADYRLHY